jgi:HSP20 family molecular chaperone IbpA
MSYFPVTHYRSFNDPYDRFFNDQLHFFDPWRDFDTFPTALSSKPSSFRWINQPRRISRSSSSYHTTAGNTGSSGNTLIPVTTSTTPALSEKFRVQLNVAGFNPETIKTRVEGRKVIVEAKQEDRQGEGDYSIREIRKTYELPEHADTTNLASFVTPNNMLVVEVPVHQPRIERRLSQTLGDSNTLSQFGQYRDPIFDYAGFVGSSDFGPRIIDTNINGEKQLKMSLPVKNYRPEQIKVSVKNNELIVQAENVYNDNNRSERSFLTKSITLPPGTQVEQLRSFLNTDGQLEIEAPFIEPNQGRSIEVQHL